MSLRNMKYYEAEVRLGLQKGTFMKGKGSRPVDSTMGRNGLDELLL